MPFPFLSRGPERDGGEKMGSRADQDFALKIVRLGEIVVRLSVDFGLGSQTVRVLSSYRVVRPSPTRARSPISTKADRSRKAVS